MKRIIETYKTGYESSSSHIKSQKTKAETFKSGIVQAGSYRVALLGRLTAITLLFALGISGVAMAQPRAVGGRIGYGLEVTYQHTLANNFVEADFGLFGFHGFNVSAVYDFMIAKPEWSAGTWGFYAGPGAAVCLSFPYTANAKSYAGFIGVGVGGQIGLEYILPKTPLQISIDWRPVFGPQISGDGIIFWQSGLCSGGLSLRYFF